MLEICVYGTPRPKGSMKPIPNRKTGGTILIDANKHVKPWQKKVEESAHIVMAKNQMKMTQNPVSLKIDFCLPRPKSISLEKRPYPIVPPDLDKLQRAVLDGLTGILYHDDGQVVRIDAEKRYVKRGDERAVILVNIYSGMAGTLFAKESFYE